MVIEPVTSDDLALPTGFVVGEPGKADAEAGDPSAYLLYRERGDQTRVDAARQLQRIADVALQMIAHRPAKRVESKLARLVGADGVVRPECVERVGEPALDVVAGFQRHADEHPARHLFNAFEIALPTGRKAER